MGILIGLLSAAIALAGSYWIYRRSKRDEEIQWRIENIYEPGLEELNAVLEDIDTAILNTDSPEEVRDFMVQDEDFDENPYPDEPTIFMGGGLRPEQLSFWEDEFPEWAECLYQAIEEGYVEQYFKAREQESNTQQDALV